MANIVTNNSYIKTNNQRTGSVIQAGGTKKKLLPEVNRRVSLRRHGYKLHRSKESRRRSLKRASKKYGTLPVLRRVNLIRNYSKKYKEKYKKLSKDVDFMKKTYADEKKKGKVQKGRRRTRKTKTTKKGTKNNKKKNTKRKSKTSTKPKRRKNKKSTSKDTLSSE